MQAVKTTEQLQDSRPQNDSAQGNIAQQRKSLDSRYGKIGIPAVAAALCHQAEQRNVNEYRIPYDRD